MTRRLLKRGAMIGLIIVCLGTSGLWVRSYFRVDVAYDQDAWRQGTRWYYRTRSLRSDWGGVWLNTSGFLVDDAGIKRIGIVNPGRLGVRSHPAGTIVLGRPVPNSLWFDFYRKIDPALSPINTASQVPSREILQVYIPYWAIVIPTGLPPAIWLIRWRRAKRRHAAGHCVHCGYDLRESPTRCPECGHLIDESNPATPTQAVR